MPLYDYLCPECGDFSAWGSIQSPRADTLCPTCSSSSVRQIRAPRLAVMPADKRRAHERNEKSAHEPVFRRRAGCGCSGAHTCANGRKSAAGTRSDDRGKPGLKMQTGAAVRPWMLGH